MIIVGEVYSRADPASVSSTARWRDASWLSVWLWRIAIAPIAIVLWQLAYHFKLSSRALLPSPTTVWNATVSLQTSGVLWTNLSSTAQAVIEALLLAAVIGLPLGMVLGMAPRTWAVLAPYLNALNSMPRIAFAPVFIVLFGIGQSGKVALGFSVTVFVFMMNARVGVLSADDEHRKVCLTLGASRLQLLRVLYLPVAIPAIFAALRVGMVYALLGVVSSEIIASKAGVGQLIASYSATLSMADVYSLLIILAILASVVTTVAGAVEGRLLRWQRAGTQN
jgi:ABC-type nitrate/sulfonate/bicarbonate transport system permease component